MGCESQWMYTTRFIHSTYVESELTKVLCVAEWSNLFLIPIKGWNNQWHASDVPGLPHILYNFQSCTPNYSCFPSHPHWVGNLLFSLRLGKTLIVNLNEETNKHSIWSYLQVPEARRKLEKIHLSWKINEM